MFMLFPVLGTFFNSLWKDVTFLPKKFIGLQNYLRLFQDKQFVGSLFFTLAFTISSVFFEMVLGIIMALIINEKFKLRGLLRGIILLPWAIPSIIGARIWQLIYQYEYGPANFFWIKLFHHPINWLGTSTGAFFSLLMADVWRTTPFVAIILLAGLQTIPEEIYKQAKVDGTNMFSRFFKITLPLMKPLLLVALLFRTIDALRVFDIIYIITNGGPGGATSSLSLYGYKYFLLGDFGYGSTVSVILFFIALGMALIYLKIGKYRETTL